MDIKTQKLESTFNSILENHPKIKNTTSKERIIKLRKLKKNIFLYRNEIKRALFEDFKKSSSDVDLTEIFPVISEIKHNIRHLNKWMKDKIVPTPLTLLGSKSYIKYEPKGIILIMTPWNFPINLTFVSIINAISAGNSIIIKPSEISEKTSIIIKKIVANTFDKNEIKVILGGTKTAQKLLKLKFNHILFIGSSSIGKIVMQEAAKNLASVTLELGGKSPTIIDEKCNINKAAKRIAWSKFLNNGQVCIAPDYLFVHNKIKEKFIKQLILSIKDLYSNDPIKSDDYCRIVNKKHFNRLINLLEDAKQLGSNIIYGGNINEKENFIEPTLLDNISEKSKMYKEEIFGPLFPIFDFNKIEDVIEFINKNEKPLALYIFSKNNNNIKAIINNTSSGGVCINHSTLHYSNNNLPFGGINNSGTGRCHGIYGFHELSNKKSILKQVLPSSPTDFLFPPYNNFKNKLIEFTIKWL
ncbi:MAG: aldehyde dehydrogenase family protein [Bacteroidota bacterium]|nr:aldehyde dehydrogenase family protein [Bacteroidota bacterium]